MGNFNVTEYLQYYRSIATLHPSINGFYTMDINEVLGDLRSGMKYPALILNSVNGFLSRNLSADNTQNLVKAGFMVIDHVDSVDDFQKEMQKKQMEKTPPRLLKVYRQNFSFRAFL